MEGGGGSEDGGWRRECSWRVEEGVYMEGGGGSEHGGWRRECTGRVEDEGGSTEGWLVTFSPLAPTSPARPGKP